MASKHTASQPTAIPSASAFFLNGAGAGLIAFLLVGGAWQVSHFWWVMAGTTLSCGLMGVVIRLEFQKTLDALLENLPWI